MFAGFQGLFGYLRMGILLRQDYHQLNLPISQKLVEVGIMFRIGMVDRTVRLVGCCSWSGSGGPLHKCVEVEVGDIEDEREVENSCRITVSHYSDIDGRHIRMNDRVRVNAGLYICIRA